MQLTNGDTDLTPTAPKPRQVLALLVMRRNQVVRLSELVTELWGENPPPSALPTVQTYVYKLRKLVRRAEPGGGRGLLTRPHGYLLSADEESLDAGRFTRLTEAGRAALERADFAVAARQLSEALALWRGPALVDLVAGDLLAAHVTRLAEIRLEVLELRIRADLELGRHQELVSELKALTANYPLHEGFHGQLMLALHRSRRRCEALETYQRLRRTLLAELGVQPPEALRELHRALLRWDPSLLPSTQVEMPAPPEPADPVPAQLPPDPPQFSGRAEVVDQLTATLATPVTRTAARLVSITGMPGVGKTEVAVRAAHRVRSRFPDGQLFVDLRGSTLRPVPTPEALAELLRSCGVPPDRLPDSTEERSALLRTICSRRRMLIVLDDAASAAAVSPLLPGSTSCAVVVTTRADPRPGAARLSLPPFDVEEGVELLSRMLGRERVRGEARAAQRIVAGCSGIPLAVRAAGARLAAAPDRPLAQLADRLAGAGSALDELLAGDGEVPARYDGIYWRLRGWDRSAFRLLSLMRRSEFGIAEAAALLGCDEPRTRLLLDRLVEQHLLWVQWRAGPRDQRYGFHRLARAYARRRLEDTLGGGGASQRDAGGILRLGAHGASVETGPRTG